MRKIQLLLALLLFCTAVCGQIIYDNIELIPNPKTLYNGYVSDPDSNISRQEEELINYFLKNIDDSSGVEIAVVVVNSIGVNESKDFRYRLFNHWGIGKKGKDNGLLLLIVKNDHSWDFETGYGLEAVLTDGRLKLIGENIMVPEFREDSIGNGVLKAMIIIQQLIANDTSVITSIDQAIAMSENPYGTAPQESYEFDEKKYVGEWMNDVRLLVWLAYAAFTILAIISLFLKRKNKTFEAGAIANDSIWGNVPNTYARWTVVHLIIPLCIPLYMYLLPEETTEDYESAQSIAYASGYLLLNVLLFDRALRVNRQCYDEDNYLYYKKFKKANGWSSFILLIFVFPLFTILYLLWVYLKKRSIRNRPVPCPNCTTAMHKLNEKDDDTYLNAGQQLEEKLGSRDYDAWVCHTCQHHKVLQYENSFSSYRECKSCHYTTSRRYNTETITAPTYTSSGTALCYYECKHCGHKFTETITLAKLEKSSAGSGSSKSYSSSSGYSGGGGGGGSFGGGKSGGGGAGGRW